MPDRDPIDVELLDALARILQSTGVDPRTQQQHFARICRRLAKTPTPRPQPYLPDLSQILAQWHRNPLYLNRQGAPRALPLKGRHSLQSLAKNALPSTKPADAIAALEHNRAIRRTRAGYLPTDSRIVFVDDDLRAHALDALRALLSTLEHNLGSPRGSFKQFECIGSHPNIPRRALRPFDAAVRPLAMEFLQRAYADLTRHARRRTRGQATARMGVGVYVFEDRTASNHVRRPAR